MRLASVPRRYQAGFGEFVSRNMAAVLNLNLVKNFRKIIYGLSPSECSIRRSLGLESRGLGPGPAAALSCSSGPGTALGPGFSSGHICVCITHDDMTPLLSMRYIWKRSHKF